jgi:hypothetical protein
MSLYCATGGVENDLLAQLQDLFAESLAKLGQRNHVLVLSMEDFCQSISNKRAAETRQALE